MVGETAVSNYQRLSTRVVGVFGGFMNIMERDPIAMQQHEQSPAEQHLRGEVWPGRGGEQDRWT